MCEFGYICLKVTLSQNIVVHIIDQTQKCNVHLFFSDLNELSENNISVNSNFISKFKNIPISLDFEFDNYFNYNSAQKKPYETTEQEHFSDGSDPIPFELVSC